MRIVKTGKTRYIKDLGRGTTSILLSGKGYDSLIKLAELELGDNFSGVIRLNNVSGNTVLKTLKSYGVRLYFSPSDSLSLSYFNKPTDCSKRYAVCAVDNEGVVFLDLGVESVQYLIKLDTHPILGSEFEVYDMCSLKRLSRAFDFKGGNERGWVTQQTK